LNCFITGIEGFVGHHLAAHLAGAGDRVAGCFLDQLTADDIKDTYQLFPADIVTGQGLAAALEQTRPECVFHLAAQSSAARSFKEPRQTFEANVIGTVNLLEAVRNLPARPRLVLVSSCEVYGPNPGPQPMDESQPYRPVSPYGSSKAAQELVALQYQLSYGLEVVVARPFPHLGPGQSEAFALPSFAKQIAEIEAGRREPVVMVGNLEPQRDFSDVRDVVRAYRLLAEKGQAGQAYNICSGKPIAMCRALEILLKNSKTVIDIRPDPERLRPSDVPLLWGDCRKLREATGWEPEHDVAHALADLLEHWRHRIAQ